MEELKLALRFSAKKEKVILRQKASDGIWVSFLLPAAVLVSGLRVEGSPLYISNVIYSLNMLLNVFHLLYHIARNKSLYVTKGINILCAIPSSITIFFYVNALQLDIRQSLCYTVANALIYFEGVPFLLKVFPNSFTFGEANIAIQGISLFLFSTFIRLNKLFLQPIQRDEFDDATTILQIGLLGMLILSIVPFIFPMLRNPVNMYVWIAVVIFGFITFSLDYIFGENPFLWLLKFFLKQERCFLIALWLICSFTCGLIIWHRLYIKKQADTVVRKYFHIISAIVFVTGVIFDTSLIYFASGCAFSVLILLEICRIARIPPLWEVLQNSFLLYADEKDSGIVALTPMYLLIGYSVPLWLHPWKLYSHLGYLQLLSGVISIGVGDTCASIFGKTYGKHKWSGSNKTIEGTIACVCGQVVFVVILTVIWHFSYSSTEYFKIFLAIMIPSFIEAFTDQIDNIVLPIVTYILLMV